jgi:hypothetical protein
MALKKARPDRFHVGRVRDPESGRVRVLVEVGGVRALLTPGGARSLGDRLRSEAGLIESEERRLRKEEAERAAFFESMRADPRGGPALALLGVSQPFTSDDLKAAYRRRAKETHPDRGGSAEEFRRVREAYEWLAGGWFDESFGWLARSAARP